MRFVSGLVQHWKQVTTMATIQPNTEANATTQTEAKFFARAHKIVRNGKPSKDFAAVLMDESDAEVDQIPFATFTSVHRAETAGRLHWPQAHLDVDEMVRVFDEKYMKSRSKVIAKYREGVEAEQAARSMAAREGITIEAATAKMKVKVEVVDDAEVFAD